MNSLAWIIMPLMGLILIWALVKSGRSLRQELNVEIDRERDQQGNRRND